jgi:hypothetical protein
MANIGQLLTSPLASREPGAIWRAVAEFAVAQGVSPGSKSPARASTQGVGEQLQYRIVFYPRDCRMGAAACTGLAQANASWWLIALSQVDLNMVSYPD